MAFQMGIIVFGAAFGGIELDKYITSIAFPLFTIIFIIFGVFAAVYISLKDFIKPNKKN
jgi:F0F1-type ATP synthase assembly protein I